MVRLEVRGKETVGEARSFQFHYGTIRRTLYIRAQGPSSDFNSTMVRLEGS